jgi:hypothetical protein
MQLRLLNILEGIVFVTVDEFHSHNKSKVIVLKLAGGDRVILVGFCVCWVPYTYYMYIVQMGQE